MSDEVKAAVLFAERRWVEAHLTLDLETIESMLSGDYRQIQVDGSVIDKDELLKSYHSGARRWEIARSDELEVFLQGEIAWVIGKWYGKGFNAGEAFDYQARFLAVYRMEAGEWKLTADVSIPIA